MGRPDDLPDIINVVAGTKDIPIQSSQIRYVAVAVQDGVNRTRRSSSGTCICPALLIRDPALLSLPGNVPRSVMFPLLYRRHERNLQWYLHNLSLARHY
jgi:hypothetical protein